MKFLYSRSFALLFCLLPFAALAQTSENNSSDVPTSQAGGPAIGQSGLLNSGGERGQRLRQFLQRRAQGGGAALGSGRFGASAVGSAGAGSAGSGLAAMRGRGRSGPVTIDPSVKVQNDIPYGKDPRQTLDIYSPKEAKGPLPVIFFCHGGGWSIGNKSLHTEKGSNWASNGVIFVATNYRLAPNVMHPNKFKMLLLLFAWVKKHATEIGADPNRIYVMGHSAGAQLVDLLGTNERFLAEQGLTLKDVKGVVSLDTASLELNQRLVDSSVEGKAVGGMITTAFGNDPKVLADASPTSNIHAGTKYPDFLLFCGAARKSCVEQHKVFSQAMEKVGGKVTVKAVPLSHSEINKAAGQTNSDIFKQVMEFVRASGNLQ